MDLGEFVLDGLGDGLVGGLEESEDLLQLRGFLWFLGLLHGVCLHLNRMLFNVHVFN